jgi:hypothetical protein
MTPADRRRARRPFPRGREMTTDRHSIHAAFAAARARSRDANFIGQAELYCESPDCAVRYVEITVNECGVRTPPRLSCPACQRPLKVHHVLSLDEAEAARARQARARQARASVNTQRYRRDHPDELAVPADVLLDERLP